MNLLAPLPPGWSELLRTALEVAATLAFALSGVIAAARQRLDVVGVCVVAFAAAFGGGTLRDLLLDQRPFSGCATSSSCGPCWRCAWPPWR